MKLLLLLILFVVSSFTSSAQENEVYDEAKLLRGIDSILALFPEKVYSYSDRIEVHRESFVQDGHLFLCYTESKPNPKKIEYYTVLEIDLKKIEISCLEFDDCIIPAHASFKPYRVYSKKASGKSKRKYVSSYFDNLNSFNKGEWQGWHSYPFDIENELYTSDLDNALMIDIYTIARHYEGGVDVRLEIPSLDSKTEFFGIKVDSQKNDYIPFIQKAEVREVGGPTWYILDPAKIQFPQIFGCDSISKVSLRFESYDRTDQLRVLQFHLIHKDDTDIVNDLRNEFGETTSSSFGLEDFYIWEGKEILILLTSFLGIENDMITLSFLFE